MATIKKEYGWEYNLVDFKVEVSENEFCICDACNKKGEVMKLTLPETSYRPNGQLTTRHREYWLCPRCYGGLMSVLIEPEEAWKDRRSKQNETK